MAGGADAGCWERTGAIQIKQREQQGDADALRHGATSRVVKLRSLTPELEIRFPEKHVSWSIKCKTSAEDWRQQRPNSLRNDKHERAGLKTRLYNGRKEPT